MSIISIVFMMYILGRADSADLPFNYALFKQIDKKTSKAAVSQVSGLAYFGMDDSIVSMQRKSG
jgi:hypothetical protein